MRSGILVVLCLAAVLSSCREDNTQRSEVPGSAQSASSSNQTVPTGPLAQTQLPISTVSGTAMQSAGADCYKGEAGLCGIEQEIFAKTNALRAAQGLSPLRYSGNMAYIARQWSQSQSQTGMISHMGFPAQRTAAYQAEFGSQGKRASLAAENVATTFGSSAAGGVSDSFMKMWTNSSGHRRNMLGNFQSIGIGVYQKGSYWYATQIFGTEN